MDGKEELWRKVEADVAFVCDGQVEGCPKSGCYLHGGDCFHTTDPMHARNFRFEGLRSRDGAPMFVERFEA